jgi:hypothetical protein
VSSSVCILLTVDWLTVNVLSSCERKLVWLDSANLLFNVQFYGDNYLKIGARHVKLERRSAIGKENMNMKLFIKIQ